MCAASWVYSPVEVPDTTVLEASADPAAHIHTSLLGLPSDDPTIPLQF